MIKYLTQNLHSIIAISILMLILAVQYGEIHRRKKL